MTRNQNAHWKQFKADRIIFLNQDDGRTAQTFAQKALEGYTWYAAPLIVEPCGLDKVDFILISPKQRGPPVGQGRAAAAGHVLPVPSGLQGGHGLQPWGTVRAGSRQRCGTRGPPWGSRGLCGGPGGLCGVARGVWWQGWSPPGPRPAQPVLAISLSRRGSGGAG